MRYFKIPCFIFLFSLLLIIFATPVSLAQSIAWLDINNTDFKKWQNEKEPCDCFLVKNVRPEYVKDLEDYQKEIEEFDNFLKGKGPSDLGDILKKIEDDEKNQDKKEIVYDPKDKSELVTISFLKAYPTKEYLFTGGDLIMVISDPKRKKDILLWYIKFDKKEYSHNDEFPSSKMFYMNNGKWVEVDEEIADIGYSKALSYFLYKKTGEFLVFTN